MLCCSASNPLFFTSFYTPAFLHVQLAEQWASTVQGARETINEKTLCSQIHLYIFRQEILTI
jgi:hypothetical protein